jgi:hypothetical protein
MVGPATAQLFRELMLDDKVGEDLRIAAEDSHEVTNFLTQLVKKCDIGVVRIIIVRNRFPMNSRSHNPLLSISLCLFFSILLHESSFIQTPRK